MIAVIELKEELYVVTIVGDYRPEVRTYYTQNSFMNLLRGRKHYRARLDLIVLKDVELEEEVRTEISACLVPNGRFLTIGSKFPALREKIRVLADEHYENIPCPEEGEAVKWYEAGVIAYISKFHDKILEVLDK